MSKRASVLKTVAGVLVGTSVAYVAASHTGSVPSGLLTAAPLLPLTLGLVLSPAVYQRLKRHAPADDPSYAGYAYVECPECRHIVPMSAKTCPLCGAELFAPWTNASRHA